MLDEVLEHKEIISDCESTAQLILQKLQEQEDNLDSNPVEIVEVPNEKLIKQN